MNNTTENISITFEEALQDPKFAHFHDAIRSVQNRPNKDIFPKKHELSVTNVAVYDAVRIFNENPFTPLKIVVTTIINSFPDDISAELIVKMTKKIIAKWESLSATLHQNNETLIAA
jgi:hypothetical protein